jgi:hypothetical protein
MPPIHRRQLCCRSWRYARWRPRFGVLALTTFATIRLGSREDGSSDDIDVVTSSDAFRAVHSEHMEALNQRKAELDDLLDEALSIALVELMKYV